MRLTFELRTRYGRRRFYPTNELARVLVESIAGRVAFEESHLSDLAGAGFQIETGAPHSGAPQSGNSQSENSQTENETKENEK